MPLPNDELIAEWLGPQIEDFHHKRAQKLSALRLNDILKRKNPYLFRAKNILTADQLIRPILDAHLSSQEETMFGDVLEPLAVWINEACYGGWKSSATGVDLEFDKDGIRYIVAIKSGPNWGNKSQIDKMKVDFKKAQMTLRTGNSKLHTVAVNGCCYGRNSVEDQGEYRKICGQSFWQFVSGDAELYLRLIEPVGHQAHERDELFQSEYAKVSNRLMGDLIDSFCDSNGAIDWEKLLRFNSGKRQ